MDEFGDGQVVQQSLFETNGDWHMSRALEHYVRTNPEAAKLVEVIIVDKDLNEIRVLRSFFPNARVLICVFHTLKWLALVSRKPEFGKVSAEDHEAVDHVVHGMVYARDDAEYEAQRRDLRVMCQRIGFSAFYDYMERNWHPVQEMWVMHRRERLPHFQNHTNNRLESYFGKLKGAVSGATSMAACMAEIVASERRRENEYKHRKLRVGRHMNTNFDEELNQVLLFTTHFVADYVAVEYKKAIERCSSYKIIEEGEVALVTGQTKTHSVNTLTWSCDCAFASSMKLPCRHSMAVRKITNRPGSIIPLKRINTRYFDPVMSKCCPCFTGTDPCFVHGATQMGSRRRRRDSSGAADVLKGSRRRRGAAYHGTRLTGTVQSRGPSHSSHLL